MIDLLMPVFDELSAVCDKGFIALGGAEHEVAVDDGPGVDEGVDEIILDDIDGDTVVFDFELATLARNPC